ncbi:MAG TPA: S1C family serine protease [Acidimicrobiales bacterium]|nr:S1C family serine protease [Acidimicrobiales bacterium]
MAEVDILEQLQAATEAVAGRAGGSVVGIGHGWGRGSGVVIGDGLVLTNAHNVHDHEVPLRFGDGRTVVATVAGIDVDGDLAVLSADTAGAPPIEWGVGVPAVGSVVFALANPGGRGLRVTLGQVSSVGRSFRGPRGRRVTGSVEHTAPMAKGSSGGPVVDAASRFVGLNTNRLGEGFYLALPADADLRSRVEALSRGESTSRLFLGVGLVPGRAARQMRRSVGLPDRDGLLVSDVRDESPAAWAGLRGGDLIVEASGRPIAKVDELHTILDGLDESSSLSLRVVRGADELSVTVSFGPDAAREEGSA